ncbi:MAG: FAD-dependent oxidoreductase, partial [Phaeodactylibacter sp.]|nr:FAD-dependent oxidoreductase [Phaeodactylibacter sp.]
MKRLLFFLSLLGFLVMGCQSPPDETAHEYDLCVYGGTSAGVIAAHAANKLGLKTLLIEPGTHLGGLSSSGLGSTDIGNKHAVTGLSRDFYRRLGKHYGIFEAWTFEPSLAEATFEEYIAEANVEVWRKHRILSATKEGTNIQKITLEDLNADGAEKQVSAKVFLDCTYEGDLLAAAGVSYTVGREANTLYNETLNGVQLRKYHQFEDGIDPFVVPGDSTSGLLWGINGEEILPDGTGDKKVQAYNYRLCWSSDPANQVAFADTKPADYDVEKYALLLRLIESREAMGMKNHNAGKYFIINHMPNKKTDINNKGAFSTDYIGGNWAYPEASYDERDAIWKDHESYIKGLCYFLATDPRVPKSIQDDLNTWGWAKDEFTDNGHFPHQMYVREARRMVGTTVMTEHHCLADEIVSDPIGLAAYTMDSHNCDRVIIYKDGKAMVKNEGNVEVGGFPPFAIGYAALTPNAEECTNLLVPVALSASHIAYGSIRMEPVFMVMGQVTAIAAQIAIEEGTSVQEVDYKKIVASMDTDPLLNGARPDILVDNADAELVTTTGNWQDTSRWMGQYKTNYAMAIPDQDSDLEFSFQTKVERPGAYQLYLYVPRRPRGLKEAWSTSLPVSITHQESETSKTIDLQANERDWVDLGKYTFEAGGSCKLTLNAK